MRYNTFIHVVVLLIVIAILYKLWQIDLDTSDTAIAYYFVILYLMEVSFNHIYEGFGDFCI